MQTHKIDTNKVFEKTLEDLGGDDLDDFQQTINQQKFVSVHMEYSENSATEWNLAPQGTLPTLTSLKDDKGQQIKWEDLSLLVDGTILSSANQCQHAGQRRF